ncbi:U32 family peptidase C-terminal domain-containing protein [Marinobacterium aestuariivivens]|uniref:U32 family peptidase C-terminal domain-containing protein n=1 Tax=Marinobacterium aestuariivivens TaxID=1698799 RepID=A0ABW1ZW55_9GAMM
MGLMDELENLASRGYTEGFYRRHVHDEYQNYETGNSVGVHQQFVGEVLGRDSQSGMLEIDVKNRFERGDSLELMTPAGNRRFRLDVLENRNGQAIEVAPGSGHRVRIPLDTAGDLEFALLMRDLPNAPAR